MIETQYKILIKGARRIIPFHPPLHSDDEHYTTVMIPFTELNHALARYDQRVHIQRVRRDAIRTVYLRKQKRTK